MEGNRRISVNTSLKNARIFDEMYYCDDASDFDFKPQDIKYSPIDNGKPNNTPRKLGKTIELDYQLPMIKQENTTDVKIKTEPLLNDIQSFNGIKIKTERLDDESPTSTEMLNSEHVEPSTSSQDSDKKEPKYESPAPTETLNSEHVQPSTSSQDSDRKEPKYDFFWNVKREVCEEDSLQEVKQDILSSMTRMNHETFDESTNEEASKDSCSNQGLKSSKRSVFSRLSPYHKGRGEFSQVTDKVNQCVKNLSLQKMRFSDRLGEHIRSGVGTLGVCETVAHATRRAPSNIEYESDPLVLARRQKQIDFGKNTIGYDNYIRTVPRYKRKREEPTTPNKYRKYSRRGWDSLIKHWRLKLHNYD